IWPPVVRQIVRPVSAAVSWASAVQPVPVVVGVGDADGGADGDTDGETDAGADGEADDAVVPLPADPPPLWLPQPARRSAAAAAATTVVRWSVVRRMGWPPFL